MHKNDEQTTNGAGNKRQTRGVRVWFNAARPNRPFAVSWRDENGARKTETFATEKDRDKRAAALEQMRRRAAVAEVPFDPTAWHEFQAFRRATNQAPLYDIAALWNARKPISSMTVQTAVDRFLASKEAEGIGKDSLRHYRANLRRFTAQFGSAVLGLVSAEDLQAFIDTLPFAAYTKDSHHRCLRTLFAHATLHEWLASNPMRKVRRVRIEETEINLLTVEEGRRLFEANRGQPCIGRLALEAFAGLRYTSAAKIRREDIKLMDLGIDIPAASIKTRSREYIDGLPPNLWEWLRIAPEAGWELTERQYLYEKTKAFIRAGVENTGNVLRHSFCSYHYAAFKNPSLTAAILCHTNLKTMRKHYKGKATEKDGRAWFKIAP